jgi:hypothetical protein
MIKRQQLHLNAKNKANIFEGVDPGPGMAKFALD